MNDRLAIGGNQPNMVGTVTETTADISAWMAEHPVIEDENKAREAKVFLDRGKLAVADLEDERKAKVEPLNIEVKKINDRYRHPRELLERVVNELKRRIDKFLQAEENRRQILADRARRESDSAREVAEAHIRAEQDAQSEAAAGVLGVDSAALAEGSAVAVRAAEKAEHQAQIAEREAAKVKVGGGFMRAVSLRTTEHPVIIDIIPAIYALWPTNDIKIAVERAARAYKKLHGKWPSGVEGTIERKT